MSEPAQGSFALAEGAAIVVAEGDAKVAGIAARDLADDIEKVTGRKPALSAQPGKQAIILGTLGRSKLIDRIAASGKADLRQLRGAWESFVIAVVERPLPGVERALVIAGSDPRGTAYGAYELSQAIGVSPWNWWADVTPERKAALYAVAGTRRYGPPSVKYRGIFINDEDWGLHPWAARTFEPESGGIGPRTYAKVYELLLRLKANSLWPGMHPPTKAFNADPRNAALANDYAIVMGSSHAEPMLRNNGKEWKFAPDQYNYETHPDLMLQYWRERVETNKHYENLYTMGTRGINDSRMLGPKDDAGRIALLERIFADQRALLPKGAAQVFTPYKEVLDLYAQGLKVPEDITIVWPDDNYGYIRRYANEAERRRSGGMGVYYHISYSGLPMSYLWLNTTPPALVWEEMSKAYDHGARTQWIVNVGDIKPAEIGMEFFLQMAWDIKRWQRDTLPDYLRQWAAREFGAAHAQEIAAIMDQYYRLNYDRKPEHLQWWLPRTTPRPSDWSPERSRERLRAFAELRQRTGRLQPAIAAIKQDAFFELIAYPVYATALANERYFEAELGNLEQARAANSALAALTQQWHTTLAGGKWKHFMAEEPADDLWKGLRLSKWTPELALQASQGERPAIAPPPLLRVEAEAWSKRRAGRAGSWEIIPGLGHTGAGSVAIFPTTTPSYGLEQLADQAPRMDYEIELPAAGEYRLEVQLLPTHALSGAELRFGVAVNGGAPAIVAMPVKDGSPDWAQGVLNARRIASATVQADKPGRQLLSIYGVDAGVLIDSIEVRPSGGQQVAEQRRQ